LSASCRGVPGRRRLAALVVAALVVATTASGALGRDRDEDNPHEKMSRAKSKAICLDCHTRLPKPDEHAADYLLVDAPSETCLVCHGEYQHPGAAEHAGKPAAPLPADENGKIACFTCHDPHPEGVLPGRTVYRAEAGPFTRALMAARELPEGVERVETQFGALLRFPPADGGGCSECHAAAGGRKDEAGAEPSWRRRLTWSEFIRVLPRY
jgi:hypothetical protein